MEDFDFTSPINATVIYEESDDDIIDIVDIQEKETNDKNSLNISNSQDKSCKENGLENVPFEPGTSNIDNKIINSPSKLETLESIKIKRLNTGVEEWVVVNADNSKTDVQNNPKSQTPLDMPLILDDNSATEVKNNHKNQISTDITSPLDINTTVQDIINHSIMLNTQNKETQNKSDSKKQRKRRKSVANSKTPKRRLSQTTHLIRELDKTDGIPIKSISTDINIKSVCRGDINAARPLLESQKYDHRKNSRVKDSIGIPINVIQNPNQQKPSTEDAQSLNAINGRMDNNFYTQELLNSVSENMIYIITSHHTYARLNKINVDRSLVEHAKNNFIQTKFHFFDLSYSTVLNVIIPREKDLAFVTDFINNTIRLARSKSYQYETAQMEPLYLEMIDWVKKRQNQILSMNLNSRPNLLINDAYRPPPPYPLYPYSTKQQIQSNFEGNHSFVTPERNTTYLNYQTEFTKNQNRNYSVIMPPLKTQESVKRPIPNTPIQQKSSFGLYSHVRALLNQPIYHRPYSHMPPHNNMTLPWRNKATEANNCIQNQQPSNKQHLQNFDSVYNVASHKTQDTLLAPSSNESQNNLSPWPYPAPAQRFPQSYQEHQLQQNNQHALEIVNPPEQNRSSISRDSGFISPPVFNNNADDTLQCTVHDQHGSGVTPLISHVTSLNPNASYLSEGLCAVCRKTTKTKCLGCYKCYYCSQACQYLDWRKHMAVCKNEEETNYPARQPS